MTETGGDDLRQHFKDALMRGGISQRAAAERAGISETRWRQVLNTGRPAARLAQMAVVAGVTIEDLERLGHEDAALRLQHGDYPPIKQDAPTEPQGPDRPSSPDAAALVVRSLAAAQEAVEESDPYVALPWLLRLVRRMRDLTPTSGDYELLVLALMTALQHMIESQGGGRGHIELFAGSGKTPQLMALLSDLSASKLEAVIELAARAGYIAPSAAGSAQAVAGEESQLRDGIDADGDDDSVG